MKPTLPNHWLNSNNCAWKQSINGIAESSGWTSSDWILGKPLVKINIVACFLQVVFLEAQVGVQKALKWATSDSPVFYGTCSTFVWTFFSLLLKFNLLCWLLWKQIVLAVLSSPIKIFFFVVNKNNITTNKVVQSGSLAVGTFGSH